MNVEQASKRVMGKPKRLEGQHRKGGFTRVVLGLADLSSGDGLNRHHADQIRSPRHDRIVTQNVLGIRHAINPNHGAVLAD
ncbi:MAG: hypothetical protein IT427_04610 [Pirellulales bacterium]|nr:hypothetical protein [Pirellulales bacterium]